MKKIEVYTDGACSGNPGKGAWACILLFGSVKKVLSGTEEHTTNNRMELSAVIKALDALKESCEVVLYTDSKYVQQGATEWLPRWIINGWKTAAKKDVENKDLWKEFLGARKEHKLTINWVKGHADNPLNNEVDRIASGLV